MQIPPKVEKDPQAPKRPYHKPILSLIGGISDITQGGLTGSVEMGNPMGKGQLLRRG